MSPPVVVGLRFTVAEFLRRGEARRAKAISSSAPLTGVNPDKSLGTNMGP